MRTIYKFRIGRNNCPGRFALTLPNHAAFRYFNVDPKDNEIYAWFEVDTCGTPQAYDFRVFGTGHPIDDSGKLQYLATCIDDGYVWHLYKVIH